MERYYYPRGQELPRSRTETSGRMTGDSRTGYGLAHAAHNPGRTQGSLPMDLTGPTGDDPLLASTPIDFEATERRLNRSLERCTALFASLKREAAQHERGRLRTLADIPSATSTPRSVSPFSVDTPPEPEEMFARTLGQYMARGTASPSSQVPRDGKYDGVTSRRYRASGVTPAFSGGYHVSDHPLPSTTVDPMDEFERRADRLRSGGVAPVKEMTAQGPSKIGTVRQSTPTPAPATVLVPPPTGQPGQGKSRRARSRKKTPPQDQPVQNMSGVRAGGTGTSVPMQAPPSYSDRWAPHHVAPGQNTSPRDSGNLVDSVPDIKAPAPGSAPISSEIAPPVMVSKIPSTVPTTYVTPGADPQILAMLDNEWEKVARFPWDVEQLFLRKWEFLPLTEALIEIQGMRKEGQISDVKATELVRKVRVFEISRQAQYPGGVDTFTPPGVSEPANRSAPGQSQYGYQNPASNEPDRGRFNDLPDSQVRGHGSTGHTIRPDRGTDNTPLRRQAALYQDHLPGDGDTDRTGYKIRPDRGTDNTSLRRQADSYQNHPPGDGDMNRTGYQIRPDRGTDNTSLRRQADSYQHHPHNDGDRDRTGYPDCSQSRPDREDVNPPRGRQAGSIHDRYNDDHGRDRGNYHYGSNERSFYRQDGPRRDYSGDHDSHGDDRRYASMLNHLSFDGTEGGDKTLSYEAFIQRFRLIVADTSWGDSFKALRLLSCLKGKAARAVEGLGSVPVYSDMISRLDELFSAKNNQSYYELKLSQLERNVSKTDPVSFLEEVRHLCRHALPRASEADMDMYVKRYFVMGHPPNYRDHLNHVDRTTSDVNALVRAAKQFEETLILAPRRQGKPVEFSAREVTPEVAAVRSDELESILDQEIVELERECFDLRGSDTSAQLQFPVARLGASERLKLKKRDELRKLADTRRQTPDSASGKNVNQLQIDEFAKALTDAVSTRLASVPPLSNGREPVYQTNAVPPRGATAPAVGIPWAERTCFYCGVKGHGFRRCAKFQADIAAKRPLSWAFPKPSGSSPRTRVTVNYVDHDFLSAMQTLEDCGAFYALPPTSHSGCLEIEYRTADFQEGTESQSNV